MEDYKYEKKSDQAKYIYIPSQGPSQPQYQKPSSTGAVVEVYWPAGSQAADEA